MIQGWYYDPKHGGCLRVVRRASADTYVIHGVYGDDEPGTHGYWSAVARATGRDGERTHLEVDFAGKPIKPDRFLCATHRGRKIRWEDGNTWHKLFVHPRQVRS